MPDQLADLLARGERAAFHGPPATGLAPLQEAVALGQSQGRDAEAAFAAWLLGVCLSAGGRLGPALALLDPLLTVSDHAPAEQRLVASLASSTTASTHRQLGRHAAAREFDQRALALTDGTGEPAFDAHVGLASDAIGAGDANTATAALGAATALVASRSDWWRQRVRLDWARAELALLIGASDEAAIRASAALTRAEASGAPRHVAKSLLFLGVALLESGDVPDATATLRRASTLAESLGIQTVLWRSRALLGAVMLDTDVAAAEAALLSARKAVDAIAAELPAALASEFLARDDVSALPGSP